MTMRSNVNARANTDGAPPRATRGNKHLTGALSIAVIAALTMSLGPIGCASSANKDNSEMSDSIGGDDSSAAASDSANSTEISDAATPDATSNEGEIATETASVGLDDPGPSGLDAGADDSKLTEAIAKEELSDNGSFDLDAAEAQPPPAPEAQSVVSASVSDPGASPELSLEASPAAAPAAAPSANQSSAGNGEQVTLTNLKYVSRKGGGTVVIETSGPATYHTRDVPSQNQVVVEIENATLPAKFKRPFTTKDFNQSIASMNAYQDKGSNTVRVVVQFNFPQQANVQQVGNVLTVAANGAGGGGAPEGEYSGGDVAQNDGGSGSAASQDDAGGGSGGPAPAGSASDARILPSSATDPTGFENTKFYGRPISIEVRDTSVRDVINLIAEQSGANIVLAGEVDGSISLKLRQVPWDQALLIVMKTRGLGYVRQGSILRVAPYESLQKEVDAAKRVADAQKAAEPLRVKVIPVGYAKVDGLDKQITPFLTKDRGRVVSDIRTNSIIVTDTADVLARISNLVKAIDTPPLQVLIEGKIVEAREVFSRQVGINWGWDGQVTNLGSKLLTQNFKVNNGDIASLTTGGTSNISLGTFDFFGDLTASLRLYEAENLIHVISSPRVVVLNNEAANIVQSNNIPIVQNTATGGSIISSTQYQSIEMKLEVTPQVTSESDVLLNVNIKREFAGSTASPPDINKREAKTKVLVRNGQTAVIGGVYQADTQDSEAGLPWLRKIPVVGWLFKQKKLDNDKSEMLVFITPRILNAESAIKKENTL